MYDAQELLVVQTKHVTHNPFLTVGALDVVCRHYGTEYSSDELRRARNKIQQLMHDIARITIELYYYSPLNRI